MRVIAPRSALVVGLRTLTISSGLLSKGWVRLLGDGVERGLACLVVGFLSARCALPITQKRVINAPFFLAVVFVDTVVVIPVLRRAFTLLSVFCGAYYAVRYREPEGDRTYTNLSGASARPNPQSQNQQVSHQTVAQPPNTQSAAPQLSLQRPGECRAIA